MADTPDQIDWSETQARKEAMLAHIRQEEELVPGVGIGFKGNAIENLGQRARERTGDIRGYIVINGTAYNVTLVGEIGSAVT